VAEPEYGGPIIYVTCSSCGTSYEETNKDAIAKKESTCPNPRCGAKNPLE